MSSLFSQAMEKKFLKCQHYFPRKFFLNVNIIFPENFLKCLHYFPRQRKKKFMEEIDFLSLLEHFQEVVARHQLARYEDKQNLPKKSKNLRQDLSQQSDKHNLPNKRKQKNNPNELKQNKQFLTLNKTSAGQVILKSNRKQHKQTESTKETIKFDKQKNLWQDLSQHTDKHNLTKK